MRVVFLGTPIFASLVLEFLVAQGVNIVGIITKPDKPVGRSLIMQPPAVKEAALRLNIPFYQPEKVSSPEFFQTFKMLEPDLCVVVAYGEILKEHILDLPKKGCINLHASLLPKYRGASPIQQAIIHGEVESGITVMHMVRKMDAGRIIEQVAVPILPNMTAAELEAKLLEIGKPALLKVILQMESGPVASFLQNEELVSFAPKIELSDCLIQWNYSAASIHNLVRGANPEPGAWCFIEISNQKKRLKIYKTAPHALKNLSPGDWSFVNKKNLVIGCQEGTSLELVEVQLEGKKRMSAQDFMRGLPPKETLSFI